MTIKYIIRKTKLSEMSDVESAHRSSVINICSKDYTKEQIEKYSNVKYTEDRWSSSIKNDYHYVVEVEGKIEGMCHARINNENEGEIVGLYFTKKIAGHGIGKEIFLKAISDLKIKTPGKIIITSSVTARGFYEKMGFSTVLMKRANIRGAEIECYAMEKLV